MAGRRAQRRAAGAARPAPPAAPRTSIRSIAAPMRRTHSSTHPSQTPRATDALLTLNPSPQSRRPSLGGARHRPLRLFQLRPQPRHMERLLRGDSPLPHGVFHAKPHPPGRHRRRSRARLCRPRPAARTARRGCGATVWGRPTRAAAVCGAEKGCVGVRSLGVLTAALFAHVLAPISCSAVSPRAAAAWFPHGAARSR